MEMNPAAVQFDHPPTDAELGRLMGETGRSFSSIGLRDTPNGFEIFIQPHPAWFLLSVWIFVALLIGLGTGRNAGWKAGLAAGIGCLVVFTLIAGLLDEDNRATEEHGSWLRFCAADHALDVKGAGEPIPIVPQVQELVFVGESEGHDSNRRTQLLLLQSLPSGWRVTRLWHGNECETVSDLRAERLARQVAQRLGLPLRSIEIPRFA